MSTANVANHCDPYRPVPNRPQPATWFTTQDAARALKMTAAGVRHLVAVEQLACTRTPSGRRLFLAAAVLALVEKYARRQLRLVPPPVRYRARTNGTPQQLALFHVQRAPATEAKRALHKGEAKAPRSLSDCRCVR